jgi:hypothetical protein
MGLTRRMAIQRLFCAQRWSSSFAGLQRQTDYKFERGAAQSARTAKRQEVWVKSNATNGKIEIVGVAAQIFPCWALHFDRATLSITPYLTCNRESELHQRCAPLSTEPLNSVMLRSRHPCCFLTDSGRGAGSGLSFASPLTKTGVIRPDCGWGAQTDGTIRVCRVKARRPRCERYAIALKATRMSPFRDWLARCVVIVYFCQVFRTMCTNSSPVKFGSAAGTPCTALRIWVLRAAVLISFLIPRSG